MLRILNSIHQNAKDQSFQPFTHLHRAAIEPRVDEKLDRLTLIRTTHHRLQSGFQIFVDPSASHYVPHSRIGTHETLLCGPHVRSGFVLVDIVPKVGRSRLPLLVQLRTLPTEHRLQQTAHRSEAPGSSAVETGKSQCRAVQFRLVPMFDS